MNTKEFLSIILLFILVFIGLGAMSLSYGADLDVVRDFDNTTIYHTVKSDYGSQKVYGIENNAKLVTTGQGSQKTIETENGYYEYSFLSDENGVRLNSTDKVKFNVNRTLTANYDFTPYMNAEIDVIDLHGHSSSSATYPAMKHTGDSITKTFKPFTDVETGYTGLYILDLDTNVKYQPGDKFTITYNDVLSTGLNKIIKTFQYVYAKDIVIENIIVENRTVYNDTIVDRIIYNDTVVDRIIYNDTIINREVYNDTIIDRIIYNDTIVDRILYNDTIVERIIFNDTVIDRVIFNDTVIDRVIFNDTIVNRTIYNDTIVNRTIENITYVDKIIEVPVYVDKIIENVTYVNKTIEVPFYKIIVIPEIIIDNPVIPISNNNNTSQYNETNPVNYQNNNTTNLNNITSNINKENNTGTSTLDNIKTVIMKRTGTDNLIGLIIVIILFGILILIYNREDD